ncbi:MAG: response regulator [Cryomorphaceae bacterium]
MRTVQRLFFIDDDELFVRIALKIVEGTKLVQDVSVFENGQTALDYLIEHVNDSAKLPEVIFLDLSMPVMDGWTFLDKIVPLKLTTHKKIEIYICTSSISPEDVERAKAIEAVSDYVIKPFTRDKFASIVENLVMNRD